VENIQDILKQLKEKSPSIFAGVKTESLQQAKAILETEFSEDLTPSPKELKD
jgi:hypothetical protein